MSEPLYFDLLGDGPNINGTLFKQYEVIMIIKMYVIEYWKKRTAKLLHIILI